MGAQRGSELVEKQPIFLSGNRWKKYIDNITP